MVSEVIELFAGQYHMPIWFVFVAFVICVPAWVIALHRRKERGEAYLLKHPDAAIVRILRGKTTGILTVHSVDGEKPVLVSKGTECFLYLAPGEHVLSLSYQWTKISIAGKLSRYLYANRTVAGKTAAKRMRVRSGEKYSLFYDCQTEQYRFTRK